MLPKKKPTLGSKRVKKVNENRELDTGRYAFTNMNLMCICGHPLGEHDGERTKDKQYCQNINEYGNLCDCEFFTKIAKRK